MNWSQARRRFARLGRRVAGVETEVSGAPEVVTSNGAAAPSASPVESPRLRPAEGGSGLSLVRGGQRPAVAVPPPQAAPRAPHWLATTR